MHRVYIGIGSNINRDVNIKGGINAIRQQFENVVISSIYESRAYGFKGDNFYNLVAGFDSTLSLEELTEKLRAIEYSFGRKRQEEKFLSRTLDIDLLLYDDLVRHDDEYDLPRQDISDYSFVLCPLAEIAGTQRHPELRITYHELWERYNDKNLELWKVDI